MFRSISCSLEIPNVPTHIGNEALSRDGFLTTNSPFIRPYPQHLISNGVGVASSQCFSPQELQLLTGGNEVEHGGREGVEHMGCDQIW